MSPETIPLTNAALVPNRKRVLLKEQAYQRVKELILTGVFPPQSTLSERQLAEHLGMSKTPIRVALENLERQGLVTISPQRGIMVKELSAREIGELFDVRLALEPFIVANLSARGLTKAEQARLKQNLVAQRTAVESEDAESATLLDIEFHKVLVDILGNEEMITWLERCFDKLHRSVLRINRLAPGRLLRSCEDHENIVAAIIDPSLKNVDEVMRNHLHFGRQFLLSR